MLQTIYTVVTTDEYNYPYKSISLLLFLQLNFQGFVLFSHRPVTSVNHIYIAWSLIDHTILKVGI